MSLIREKSKIMNIGIALSELKKHLNILGEKLSRSEENKLNSIFADADTENSEGEVIQVKKRTCGDGFLNANEWQRFKSMIESETSVLNKLRTVFYKTDEDLKRLQSQQQTDGFDYFADNIKFDKTQFTEEKLKEAFKKCKIDVNDDYILVTDKDGNLLLSAAKFRDQTMVEYVKDGKNIVLKYDAWNKLSEKSEGEGTIAYKNGKKNFYIKNNGLIFYYNDNGEVKKVEDTIKQMETYYEKDRISKIVYNNTGLKTEFAEDGTSKTFYDGKILADKLISGEITPSFIEPLSKEEKLDLFPKLNYIGMDKKVLKELFDIQLSMIKDMGGYTEDLAKYVDRVLNSYEQLRNKTNFNDLRNHLLGRAVVLNKKEQAEIKEPNGSIDANFKQGAMGDCWLLAAIKAISQNENGLKKLNAMLPEKDGGLENYTVKFRGKDYVISSEELHSAVEYSTGELDVRKIEIAVNRFCIENNYRDITSDAGVELGFAVLFGDDSMVNDVANQSLTEFRSEIRENFTEKLKNQNMVGVIGGIKARGMDSYLEDAQTGEKVKLIQSHAYSIYRGDDEYAYIINPHDSGRLLKIKYDEILDTFVKGCLYDFKD